jgi:hypothetical protein
MSVNAVAIALAGFAPTEKSLFLAELAFYLGQAARGAYIEAGRTPNEAAERLMAYNEMQLVLASELISGLERAERQRSAGDLVDSLQHWANVGDCTAELAWACQKALGSD